MQFHQIVCRATGTALDVPDGDPTTDRVQQFQVNGGRNQQWSILDIPDTPFVSFVCRATGRALDVPDFDPETWSGPLILLKQSPFVPTRTQSWSLFREDDRFYTIDSGVAPIATRTLPGNGPGGVNHFPNEMVLDIPGGVTRDGGDVQLFPFNGGQNQRWDIELVDDIDAYIIISASSRKVFDVPGLTALDVPIQQFTYNGGPNQLWQLLNSNGDPYIPFGEAGQGPGPIFIVSVSSGKALQIDDGNGIIQSEFNGGTAQQGLVPIRGFSTIGAGGGEAWALQNLESGTFLTVHGREDGIQIEQEGQATHGWWFKRAERLYQPGLWA